MKTGLFALILIMFTSTLLYAGTGDLIVNGKIGAGISSPTEAVDVNGNIKASGNHNLVPTATTDGNIFLYVNRYLRGTSATGTFSYFDGTSTLTLPDYGLGWFLNRDIRSNGQSAHLTGWGGIGFITGSQYDINKTAMVIDYSGNVGIGTAAPLSKLHIQTESGAEHLRIYRYQDSATGGNIKLFQARGSAATPAYANVADGDFISFRHYGRNAGDTADAFIVGSEIYGAVDSKDVSGRLGGRLAFYTSSGASATPTEKCEFHRPATLESAPLMWGPVAAAPWFSVMAANPPVWAMWPGFMPRTLAGQRSFIPSMISGTRLCRALTQLTPRSGSMTPKTDCP